MDFSLWCIAIILLFAAIAAFLYSRLLAWKKWAADYKAWKARNCQCQSPGGDDEPIEPGWP